MNLTVKVGLIILVASFSTIAGNYVVSLRPGHAVGMPTPPLKPRGSTMFCKFLSSYIYELRIDAGGSEVRFMILRLEDFLASGGNFGPYSLIDRVVRGRVTLTFKPDRRGVYITIIENIGLREASVGYLVMFSRGLEQDFLKDSFLVALVGVAISIIGLSLEKLSSRRVELAH